MRLMKTTYLTLIAALLLFFGCGEGSSTIPEVTDPNPKEEEPSKQEPDEPEMPDPGCEVETVDAPHYLLRFIVPESLSARTIYGEPLTLQIYLSSFDSREYAHYWHAQNPDDFPREAAAYEALCERYGDTSYSGIRKFLPTYFGGYDALWYNIVSIDVTSVVDYDAEHPAGTSLNDLCELISWTPRDYLASGYTDRYDWTTPPDYIPEDYRYITFYDFDQVNDGLHPFKVSLSDYNADDLFLMGSGQLHQGPLFLLRFAHGPQTGNQLQRFTIRMTDEKGKVYNVLTDVCEWE